LNKALLKRNRGEGGFTLFEVLIAVALVAIVLGALYASFFTAERAVSANDETLVRLQELRALADVMRMEIEGALVPKEGRNPFVVKDRDVYGKSASGLELSTFSSTRRGPARVAYWVEEDRERLVLMKSLGSASLADEGVMEAEALEELVSFSVEAREGTRWVRTWKQGTLPEELRVTVVIPMGGRELTITQAMRPKVGRKL
jgi:general secretion pathway protein J